VDVAELGLIPRPVEAVRTGGSFALGPDTVLDADPGCRGAADWLRARLGASTGLPLRDGSGPHDAVTLRIRAGLAPQEYRLDVHADGVSIEAGDGAGAFYAAQTLRALLPAATYRRARIGGGPWTLPGVAIADRPRFGWRGAMLDVARHFLPTHDVLRFIDLIALHKINVLHLHLTDDQGWRVQIPGFPRLTTVGAWRRESPIGDRRQGRGDGRPHGGYYTGDDLREIVAYAADRFVSVVPEIDVPGHMGAAIAAYPHLGNTDVPGRGPTGQVPTGWGIIEDVLNAEQATLDFLIEVFDVVMDLFPGRYIGVGGDECPAVQWAASPRAQARIAQLGLDGPEAIRSWYTARLGEHLAAHGRILFGWDEICDGPLPPDAVVASWRGAAGARIAARAGHDVVYCPAGWVYLDYRQSDEPGEPIPVGTVTDLARVYAFDPIPPGLTDAESAHVLGAQCTVWTEHMDSARAVDYMAFPRLCAFAETVWSPAPRDYPDFQARLRVHEARLDALGVEYRRESGPLPWQTRPDAAGFPRAASPGE
jgi:hexosaminidase